MSGWMETSLEMMQVLQFTAIYLKSKDISDMMSLDKHTVSDNSFRPSFKLFQATRICHLGSLAGPKPLTCGPCPTQPNLSFRQHKLPGQSFDAHSYYDRNQLFDNPRILQNHLSLSWSSVCLLVTPKQSLNYLHLVQKQEMRASLLYTFSDWHTPIFAKPSEYMKMMV